MCVVVGYLILNVGGCVSYLAFPFLNLMQREKQWKVVLCKKRKKLHSDLGNVIKEYLKHLSVEIALNSESGGATDQEEQRCCWIQAFRPESGLHLYSCQ